MVFVAFWALGQPQDRTCPCRPRLVHPDLASRVVTQDGGPRSEIPSEPLTADDLNPA